MSLDRVDVEYELGSALYVFVGSLLSTFYDFHNTEFQKGVKKIQS